MLHFSKHTLIVFGALALLCLGALGARAAGYASYSEEGKASWYGQQFHGKTTASGEIYDMNKLTAAHRVLPLGTTVKVTHLENSRSVVVRINDRGPFIPDRIIDLSRAAAQKLDLILKGEAMVRVETVGKAPEAVQEGGDLLGAFYVQVGAFGMRENARRLYDSLRELGFENTRMVSIIENDANITKVQVGVFRTLTAAQAARQELQSKSPAAADAFITADAIR